MSGTQMLHVPYKGVALAYPAVASGDPNWVLGFPTSALPLVKRADSAPTRKVLT